MNAVFHRAKAWQLFVLTTGLLIIFLFIGTGTPSRAPNQAYEGPRLNILIVNIVIECGQFLVDLILFAWFWSISIGLKKYESTPINMNSSLFKVFFFLSLAYSLYDFIGSIEYELFWDKFKNGGAKEEMANYVQWFSNLNPLVFILTLFATFCNLYLFFFSAKMLRSIELDREAEPRDYVGYFFLIWFHFIGLWMIQPKINTIASENWTRSESCEEPILSPRFPPDKDLLDDVF